MIILNLLNKGGLVLKSMRDIAREAGVSLATVSRYINKNGYVSEEAKKKIEKIVKQTNYTPNELARAIFSKNSKIIGLLVPNISNPYFNELALIIEEYVSKHGYSLFLCNTNDDPTKEREYINVLQGHRVAGIFTVRAQCKKEYELFTVPVVSFESIISDDIVTIVTDNYQGGKLAFDHLKSNGCNHLLHITGLDFSKAVHDRYQGFLNEAKKEGMSVDIIRFESDFQRKMLEANIKTLENIEKYDGVFVFNDIAAATVIRYFKQKNVHIPDEVQVIGFDNSYIGEFLFPSLTTIEQSVQEVGNKMADALIHLINGETIENKIIMIQPNVLVRESTKAKKE